MYGGLIKEGPLGGLFSLIKCGPIVKWHSVINKGPLSGYVLRYKKLSTLVKEM